jgi:hypothetical protein
MDKLYLLFGVLTLVFLIMLYGMNTANSFNIMAPSASAGTKAQEEPFANMIPVPSAVETKIRKSMDALAFYTTPDGSPAIEGKSVCKFMTNLRDGMTQKESRATPELGSTDIAHRVDAELRLAIPGGPLTCPLLQYPANGTEDADWLAWLQSIPTDFGARVVFMIMYADENITPNEQTLKDSIQGVQDMKGNEGFLNQAICTPDLIRNKAENESANTCIMPSDITPAQIAVAVDTILAQLVRSRAQILLKKFGKDYSVDPTKIYLDMKTRVARTQHALDYINEQKEQADKSGLTGSVIKVASSGPSGSAALRPTAALA